jgi:hypothetical protein
MIVAEMDSPFFLELIGGSTYMDTVITEANYATTTRELLNDWGK